MKCLAVMLLVCACGDSGSTPDAAPSVDQPACVPATPKVVFLNRAGGTYTKATVESSASNQSTIITADVTLPPPTIVETEWTDFVTCVKSKFTPFAIDITEVDPGNAPHLELVAIDMPQQIGLSAGVGSVSPFNCQFIPNAIQFMMWGTTAAADRCWTGAQTIANGFGLDHAFSCPDLMTFDTSCGPTDQKTFTNADVPCGETMARSCCNNSPTQNSFSKLTANAGSSCQ